MKDYLLTVTRNQPINERVFELKMHSSQPLPSILAGQFLHLEVPSKGALLRRPFCIYKWGKDFVTVAVEKKGSGTLSLSKVREGDQLRAILPLGNGFWLKEEWKRVLIVGGSIGCAPLLGIMESYKDKEYFCYLGFKSKDHVMMEQEFARNARVTVCTYDGSYGRKGYQIPAIKEDFEQIKPDVILVCGSKSTIRTVKEFSEQRGIPAFVSTEQHMACGIGACLGCTCKVKDANGEVKNQRVCMDGPVFDLKDVVL